MTETEAAATHEDPQDVRDQANRVWAHAMHEDNEFAQHANFFLIAESLLVVAYSAILASTSSTGDQHGNFLAAGVIAAFGLLLTLVWGYACHHQGLQVKRVRDRAIELLPEYRITFARRGGQHVSPQALMTYAVPALASTMWVILLVLSLRAG